MDIRQTDLGGVATFCGEGPGPAQAWLVFRVGASDETLLTRGITRLVTGLALDGAGSAEAAYGAFVAGPTTAFELNGEPRQVVAMIGRLWDGLTARADRRFDRVRDREILHAGWRIPNHVDHLLATRFGPRGAGLTGQPEIGLHHLERNAVDEWRDGYFTAANAALALKNVSPEDVPQPSLPQGAWRPPPSPSPRPLTLPAWFEDPVDDVAVSSVQPDTAAVDAFTAAAVRRARRRLGADHDVELARVRVWPGLDHLVIRCSAPAGTARRVRDALLSVLDGLAAAGPDEDEVAERHRELREWRADPASSGARIEWAAHRHVLDPERGQDGALDEEDPPSVAAVAPAGRDFLATALYRLPPRAGMPPSCHRLPQSSSDGVEGTAYARVAGDSGSLVVGGDGITVTIGERLVTIRFDGCEAAARWPDGTLGLYGSDGSGAQIRPHEWVEGDAAVAAIEARVRDRTVEMRVPPPGPRGSVAPLAP